MEEKVKSQRGMEEWNVGIKGRKNMYKSIFQYPVVRDLRNGMQGRLIPDLILQDLQS